MWEMKNLQTELVEIRRYLHKNAEIGFDVDITYTYIKERLEEYGYTVQKCGKAGLVATVGEGEKTFLLRADIDALPICEKTKLSYACKCGHMHACGHDMHAAMLLGAAKLLKAKEKELKGKVKLLFQPAEELLEGAKDVIQNGALNAPTPQAGMTLHVMTGVDMPTGTATVASGISAPAADYFLIKVQGKGCHGSAPWAGRDALTVAARILLGLEELSAREIPIATPAVLTVGRLETDGADNAISDSAVLKGTMRTFDENLRKKLKKRIEEIARNIACAYQCTAKTVYTGGCPTLINDEKLAVFTETVLCDTLGKERVLNLNNLGADTRKNSGGSEDFAYISHELPTVMVALAAGEREKGYRYPLHHPKVRFDEEVLSIGAKIYASIAFEWLKAQEKKQP